MVEEFYKNVCEDITVVLCDTRSLLNKAKKIRHEVFCVEHGYESTNSNLMEEDEYDDLSHHLLALDRRTGEPVATMRLIVSKKLPLHSYLDENHILKNTIVIEGKTCEFSRLAVTKNRRGMFIAKASAGLFFAAGYLGVKLGYTSVGGIMQKSLVRVLGRAGVTCTKITEDFEHRGIRAVYVMTCFDFISHWSKYISFDRDKVDKHFERLGDFSLLSSKSLLCNAIPINTVHKLENTG